jgi:hypothetical protein
VGPAPRTPQGREDRRVAERAAHTLATELAAHTTFELATHGPFKFDIDIPKPGKVSCEVSYIRGASSKHLGERSKTYDRAGTRSFEYEFSISGDKTLKSATPGETLQIECFYKPQDANEQAGTDRVVTL